VPDFTPVTLITGFLGSGKTTLLQRLLLSPSLSDIAVLINEFGEIGLDHHLLERIDETMVMLHRAASAARSAASFRRRSRTCTRDAHAVCCRHSGALSSKAPALPIRSRSCRRCGRIRCCATIFVLAR
jgi:hypothetical protein